MHYEHSTKKEQKLESTFFFRIYFKNSMQKKVIRIYEWDYYFHMTSIIKN